MDVDQVVWPNGQFGQADFAMQPNRPADLITDSS
jgi:hypothetical protein